MAWISSRSCSPVRAVERVAKELGQLVTICARGPDPRRYGADRVQGVEEEVRVQLVAEHLELGLLREGRR